MPQEAVERDWFNVGVEVGDVYATFAVHAVGKEAAIRGLWRYCAKVPKLKLNPENEADTIEPHVEPLDKDQHAGMLAMQKCMPEPSDDEAASVHLLTHTQPQPPTEPLAPVYGPPYIPRTPVPVISAATTSN